MICENNENIYECACINRFDNKKYKAFKPQMAAYNSDSCWYSECQKDNKTFKPMPPNEIQ